MQIMLQVFVSLDHSSMVSKVNQYGDFSGGIAENGSLPFWVQITTSLDKIFQILWEDLDEAKRFYEGFYIFLSVSSSCNEHEFGP